MIRRLASGALVLAVGLLCHALPGQAEGELHIYNFADYTNPQLIKKFADTYHVKVTVDSYDTNEQMLAKVQDGKSGYDIVVPADYMAAIMIEIGLIEKTEPSGMANFKNLDPQWLHVYWDNGRHYVVPWQWGTTALAVDTAVYKGDADTLALLFDPPKELRGRINVLDDMPEVLTAALRYLKLPRCRGNADDLKKLSGLLTSAKRYWHSMSYDAIGKLTSNEVDVSQIWTGAALRARLQRPTLRYVFPKENFTRWIDEVAVLKGAKNLANAKLFQNFVMDPENAALISAYAKYANAIAGSEEFLPPEERDAPEFHIPKGGPQGEFVRVCPDKVMEAYGQVWANLTK
jgi:spermidine/putrescine transport system substrate-binding protein